MYIVCPSKGSKFFSNDLIEAEEIYFQLCNQQEFVWLLEGFPGSFNILRQSW